MGLLLGALSLPPLAILVAPEGSLACAEPLVRERSPAGGWTLAVRPRPMHFAMSGGGGDAPSLFSRRATARWQAGERPSLDPARTVTSSLTKHLVSSGSRERWQSSLDPRELSAVEPR